ncbi:MULTISPECIES: CYTH domain-containing protein [Enterococcus]|uniref:CYTH domain-containing protein n=1 Tax=Enterococcus sulfureus ATCC 49903 TaxID=1140003 RepID=S0L3B0_9ENTE|nr:CYTH domain-containing protein [Enterococcus sulfureus]EOT51474.1 hypothetical protein OMY_00188 [Enterococcus sulfureus ATCC 49903]EOT87131.1 hypothetical protein I573_00187 [Enterococcus sulfureus ATCC 49903]
MSQELEIEFKTLLEEETYTRLRQDFPTSTCYKQTNYYFDTPDFQLKQLGCGLRIRVFDTYGELTLKSPQTTGLLETTDRLTLEELTDYLEHDTIKPNGEVATYLKKLAIEANAVHCFADLATTRCEITLEEGLLALDESRYGTSGHDYELELEVDAKHADDEHFYAFLKKYNIVYQPAQNKIQRAFAERKKNQ